MKTSYSLLISAFLITTFCSCDREYIDVNNQSIYFEYSHINNAWGFSYRHWIIDAAGNVRVNSKGDSIIWIDPKYLNDYTLMFDSIIYKIDKVQLKKYVNLIPEAALGEVRKKKNHMRDAGRFEFNCFAGNRNNYIKRQDKGYKTVLLSSSWDGGSATNIDSSAIKIDGWLKGLHIEIYSNN